MRLALDEMMYAKGSRERAIPDVGTLLGWVGLSAVHGMSELASGYQAYIAEMSSYTMYLNMRDANMYRQVARMASAVYETVRSVWTKIDELNAVLGAGRIAVPNTWIEAVLVARVVATLSDVQDDLSRLFDSNSATAGSIDRGMTDVTPPFIGKSDPGIAAVRPKTDAVVPA